MEEGQASFNRTLHTHMVLHSEVSEDEEDEVSDSCIIMWVFMTHSMFYVYTCI